MRPISDWYYGLIAGGHPGGRADRATFSPSTSAPAGAAWAFRRRAGCPTSSAARRPGSGRQLVMRVQAPATW
ncbi:MAG: hypothetical protein R3A10_22100 [Caldilineaceae bacterium]